MKVRCEEYCVDYKTYSFGYRNWAVRENSEALAPLYDGGFLPYSADLADNNSFYMVRSARVGLDQYMPSSENRRVLRKFDDSVATHIIPLAQFRDASFEGFCLDYFVREHGAAVMPSARLQHILQMGIVSEIVHYTDNQNGETLGYALLASEDSFSHFWFSFYAARMARQNFGMYMMLDGLRRAKADGQSHYYLGTCYGASGRYKLNFSGTQYWDGSGWNNDMVQLKELLAAEATAKTAAA